MSAGTPTEIVACNGDVELAGTLWRPAGPPIAAVVMHPGSGPSDRDNDVFFPPIREHLLAAGIVVASFDKRGVGGSSGDWTTAGIVEQADDALAAVTALRMDHGVHVSIGLFGHSQGGWVVIEAAARADAEVAFVVTSSGPGTTMAEQERYSLAAGLHRRGTGPDEIADTLADFDRVHALLRERLPLDEALRRLHGAVVQPDVLVADPAIWSFAAANFDHDPAPALRRITVPVLAMFGGDDLVVPVDASLSVFHSAMRDDLLEAAVFPGADHRIQVGDPRRAADGYLDTITRFVSTLVRP